MIRPIRFVVAAVLLAAVVYGCGDTTVEPPLPDLEVVVLGGQGQFGSPGERLEPFRVQVRRLDNGAPRSGVAVVWSLEAGDASFVTATATATDARGEASVILALGQTLGEVQVRATVQDQQTATVLFETFTVTRPQIQSLSVAVAEAGDTLLMSGINFSPVREQNVVLFSGIRGRVFEASRRVMSVEVPRCLPSREVAVTAQLGDLISPGVALEVRDAGMSSEINPGSWLDVDDPEGLECLRVTGGPNSSYLAVVTSAGTVGATQFDLTLAGLADPGAGAAESGQAPRKAVGTRSHAAAFETDLRASEAAAAAARTTGAARTASSAAPSGAAVPEVGQRRSFKVFNADKEFDDVEAVVRYVGSRVAIYVDDAAPAGGFSTADLEGLADEFDDVVHPTVTDIFGAESDLDANERVILLFTPTVNRLTPRGADGFVGGFFYGVDLLETENSNRGEIFYALVPDPEGQFSDPRARDRVLEVTPAILAHEFQHMVHFNERILVLDAPSTDAVWLQEGLAQMAEEAVARAYRSRGDDAGVERFREGNRRRARLYMADPGGVSLLISMGKGTLEERGGGWLFLLYLRDVARTDEILGRLTRSTLSGTGNVTFVTGRSWSDLVSDWMSALYLDGRGPLAFPFEYPTVDLASLLSEDGSLFRLGAETLGSTDFTRVRSLWSSSGQHYIVVPPTRGSVALRLGGEAGGRIPGDAVSRLRVVRIF